MKKTGFLIIICILFYSLSFAEPVIEIHSDTVLPNDYIFGGILNIYDTNPETTTVEMQSGYVNYISAHDSSEVLNYGGTGNIWSFNNNSTFSMYGGEIGWIVSYDQAQMSINGGTVREQITAEDISIVNYLDGDTGWLNANGTSIINIDGGRVREGIISRDYGTINIINGGSYWMQTQGDSIVNLTRASFGFFGASEQSTINVYGQDLLLTTTGGRGYGYVAGKWLDGTEFNIPFFSEETYTHVALHEVPEPATIVLLGLGGLILRRRKEGVK